MYLIFEKYEDAEARNRKAITDRKWPSGTTEKMWQEVETVNGWALDVGNGDGLTQDELERCVIEIGLTGDDYTIFKIISEDGVITDQEKQENPSLWDKIKGWWNS
jgi:hypothetical protein